MNRVFISIGSNINPHENIIKVLKLLAENLDEVKLSRISKIYRTKAVKSKADNPDQRDYLNLAVEVQTNYNIIQLRKFLREIEDNLGRERTPDKFSPRTIDLDISLFEDIIYEDVNLEIEIPDPDIVKYPHVIFPLVDLDPTYIHPKLNRSLHDIFTSNFSSVRLDRYSGENTIYQSVSITK